MAPGRGGGWRERPLSCRGPRRVRAARAQHGDLVAGRGLLLLPPPGYRRPGRGGGAPMTGLRGRSKAWSYSELEAQCNLAGLGLERFEALLVCDGVGVFGRGTTLLGLGAAGLAPATAVTDATASLPGGAPDASPARGTRTSTAPPWRTATSPPRPHRPCPRSVRARGEEGGDHHAHRAGEGVARGRAGQGHRGARDATVRHGLVRGRPGRTAGRLRAIAR